MSSLITTIKLSPSKHLNTDYWTHFCMSVKPTNCLLLIIGTMMPIILLIFSICFFKMWNLNCEITEHQILHPCNFGILCLKQSLAHCNTRTTCCFQRPLCSVISGDRLIPLLLLKISYVSSDSFETGIETYKLSLNKAFLIKWILPKLPAPRKNI